MTIMRTVVASTKMVKKNDSSQVEVYSRGSPLTYQKGGSFLVERRDDNLAVY
ncbi:hypothetical protein [Gorillibacterium sp. CAU 1737]|uniref:hypothetical protein n=1 Tax=Gorillibacterium sp. CAU 1737 TaxID=3140362 RepID=UPI003261A343